MSAILTRSCEAAVPNLVWYCRFAGGGPWLRFDPTNGLAKIELLSMKLSVPGSGEDGEAI